MEVSALGIAVWIEVKGAGKRTIQLLRIRLFWGVFEPPTYLLSTKRRTKLLFSEPTTYPTLCQYVLVKNMVRDVEKKSNLRV